MLIEPILNGIGFLCLNFVNSKSMRIKEFIMEAREDKHANIDLNKVYE